MILDAFKVFDPLVRVRQIIGHALLLTLVLTASAQAKSSLSKQTARAEGLQFIAPFVDLMDVERTIRPIMEQPADCRRLRRATIRCQFKAYIHGDREVQSWVTVRRQPDGLLGFDLPLDVIGDGV